MCPCLSSFLSNKKGCYLSNIPKNEKIVFLSMQMAQHWFFVGKMASRSTRKPLDYAFLGILLPMLPQHINKIFMVFLLILRYAILCQLSLCCCCSIVGKYAIYQASKSVFNVGKMLVFLKVEVSESLYL